MFIMVNFIGELLFLISIIYEQILFNLHHLKI